MLHHRDQRDDDIEQDPKQQNADPTRPARAMTFRTHASLIQVQPCDPATVRGSDRGDQRRPA